ncbi:MAG: GntR family transcriptional regulator [Bacillota bacterium]
MLDRTSYIPLYVQLREILRKQIMSGEWGQDSIPSEPQLVQQYGVSRATVRKALDDLMREGLISRERGRGTFVTHQKTRCDLLGELSFAREISVKGMIPRSKVLSFSTHEAEANVGRALGLAPTAKVVEIRRLRCADAEPWLVETVHIPEHLVVGLSPADMEDGVLYDILADRYGICIGRYDTELEPIILSRRESEELGVGSFLPALALTRVVHDDQGQPIILSRRIIRGDRCKFVVKAE